MNRTSWGARRAEQVQSAIRAVLLSEWDPIGVRGIPEAADEYDSYVSTVYGQLISGATVDDISRLLARIEVEQMGISGTDVTSLKGVASHLLALNAGVGLASQSSSRARITWTDELVKEGLPSETQMVDPAWFSGEGSPVEGGWSLVLQFDPSPAEQGNPSEANVHFLMDNAPHQRLQRGCRLLLFERRTRACAQVEILD